jgi:CheY-like chemotaxis protein
VRDTVGVVTPSDINRIGPAAGCVLLVASPACTDRYPTGHFTRLAAHTTPDAIAAIERRRPAVVVIDWDFADVDARAVCRVAAVFPTVTVMASMADAANAPAAIKAGCQAILLEPVAPQLAMMRIARLSQAVPARGPGSTGAESATYRLWSQISCPSCQVYGVASFELARRRTLWFACLRCDHVWTARPE